MGEQTKSEKKSKVNDKRVLLGCFSYLHQPLMVSLHTFPVTSVEQKNVFMIKDKCAYAYCPITDQVAFCGGIDVNFSISNDVCLINLKNSSYVVTTTTMQRIGAAAVFVQGQLLIAGGKSWKEVIDDKTSFCRPLELSDTFETPKKKLNNTIEWEVNRGIEEVQRCFATALSINNKAYLIGGYCTTEQLKRTDGPTATETIAVYNKELSKWTYGPSMKTPRAECAAAAIGTDKIFVAGGIDRGQPVAGVELLDLFNKSWTIIKEDPPWPLGPCSGCTVGNKFYATGQLNRNLVSWDPDKRKWSEVILLPHLYEFIIPIEKNDVVSKFSI